MVWRQLPKLIPAGSIPVSRSIKETEAYRLGLFYGAKEAGENDKRRKFRKKAKLCPACRSCSKSFAPIGRNYPSLAPRRTAATGFLLAIYLTPALFGARDG